MALEVSRKSLVPQVVSHRSVNVCHTITLCSQTIVSSQSMSRSFATTNQRLRLLIAETLVMLLSHKVFLAGDCIQLYSHSYLHWFVHLLVFIEARAPPSTVIPRCCLCYFAMVFIIINVLHRLSKQPHRLYWSVQRNMTAGKPQPTPFYTLTITLSLSPFTRCRFRGL